MGILNSVALGKSRKSAGNVTFYNRLGVGCFRQKQSPNPSYKPSIAQAMQQKVFKFFKINVDESAIMSLLRITFDAKPKSGKSQTMYNMFYQSFMPHIVAQKSEIYELLPDALVSPSIFLGAKGSNADTLSKGQLGRLSVDDKKDGTITIDATILDELINKANTMAAASTEPFTINDVFVSIVGADKANAGKYKVVYPTSVLPALAQGVYTMDLKTALQGFSVDTIIYVVLTLAHKSGDVFDSTKRFLSTDSFVIAPATTGEEGEV